MRILLTKKEFRVTRQDTRMVSQKAVTKMLPKKTGVRLAGIGSRTK